MIALLMLLHMLTLFSYARWYSSPAHDAAAPLHAHVAAPLLLTLLFLLSCSRCCYSGPAHAYVSLMLLLLSCSRWSCSSPAQAVAAPDHATPAAAAPAPAHARCCCCCCCMLLLLLLLPLSCSRCCPSPAYVAAPLLFTYSCCCSYPTHAVVPTAAWLRLHLLAVVGYGSVLYIHQTNLLKLNSETDQSLREYFTRSRIHAARAIWIQGRRREVYIRRSILKYSDLIYTYMFQSQQDFQKR